MNAMKRHPLDHLGSGLAAMLLACCVHAQAQTQLVDPTRPRTTAAPVAVSAPARSGDDAAPRAWPKLQSVQIQAQGEASAMIDGNVVRVGERVGEATLTAISAQSIVLRTARYEQHISLTPGIAKTASTNAPMAPNQPAVALATKDTR